MTLLNGRGDSLEEKDREIWQDDNHKSLKIVTKCITTVAAISAVVYIEAQALQAGVNGVLLATSLAIITGLGGYELKGIIERRKKTEGK